MELINQVFDYSGVSKSAKGKLINLEAQVAKSKRLAVKETLAFGKVCQEAQELLAESGRFGEWIEAQGLARSTAYRAITTCQVFSGCPHIDTWEVSALHALASNEAAREKALKLSKSGVKISHSAAQQLIAEFKPEPIRTIDHDDTGEDGRTDSDGTEPPEETSPSESRSDTESAGEVEGATNSEWEEVEEEPSLTLDTDMPLPKPLDPAEQAKRAKNLANQYRDKLARAICDYHELAPNRAERDRLVKLVQGVDLW